MIQELWLLEVTGVIDLCEISESERLGGEFGN